jgi:hypothetical protein
MYHGEFAMDDEPLLQEAGYNEGEIALIKRVRKYGTRGIIRVRSSEGASVSAETARNLVPSKHR